MTEICKNCNWTKDVHNSIVKCKKFEAHHSRWKPRVKHLQSADTPEGKFSEKNARMNTSGDNSQRLITDRSEDNHGDIKTSDTSTLSDFISETDTLPAYRVEEFIQRLDNNLHYFETKERENLHVRAFCKAFRITIKKRAGDKLIKW